MSESSPHAILQQYWGFDRFRPLQEEIIMAVAQGKDTLALLPTGGGKSVCFQVPGLLRGGLTLVISPLISLMKDQVERLNRMGIAATSVTSDLNSFQLDQKLQGAMNGAYQFLYLSPERLQSEIFKQRVGKMPISLIAVDEAHCISQWGHDFRPSYRQITTLREVHPAVPIIALTASATPRVQEDIMAQLALKSPARFAKSFARPNLRYFVLEETRVTERILEIARRTLGTGIVYARTRKATEELATKLTAVGVSAAAYHGGLTSSQRHLTQERWQSGEVRVVAATNAFGMGIDKPDVRFVLHYHLPADLESYYQEAGRGGRDGLTSLAIAFLNPADLYTLERWVKQQYPTWEQLTHTYHLLCNEFHITIKAPDPQPRLLDLSGLSKKTQITPVTLYRCLTLLHQEGVLAISDDRDDYAYLMVRLSPGDYWAYKQQHPSLEKFLDFLLRTLGGEVYVRECRLLPHHWQEKMGIEPSQWQAIMDRLVQQQVIFYQAPRAQPVIQFWQARQLLQKQSLHWDKYEFLREEGERKLTAMLAYARRQDRCRSLLIQEYFGEQDAKPCGVCDVCIGRYKATVNDDEFSQIQKNVLDMLRKAPMGYRDIVRYGKVGSPAQREKVIRFLLDRQLIQLNEDGKLCLPG